MINIFEVEAFLVNVVGFVWCSTRWGSIVHISFRAVERVIKHKYKQVNDMNSNFHSKFRKIILISTNIFEKWNVLLPRTQCIEFKISNQKLRYFQYPLFWIFNSVVPIFLVIRKDELLPTTNAYSNKLALNAILKIMYGTLKVDQMQKMLGYFYVWNHLFCWFTLSFGVKLQNKLKLTYFQNCTIHIIEIWTIIFRMISKISHFDDRYIYTPYDLFLLWYHWFTYFFDIQPCISSTVHTHTHTHTHTPHTHTTHTHTHTHTHT